MDEFKPNPFKQEVINKLIVNGTIKRLPSRMVNGKTLIGIDIGAGDDHSVISYAKVNGRGDITHIWFDEYCNLPDYKWYRNPMKWYKWRKLWKKINWDWSKK